MIDVSWAFGQDSQSDIISNDISDISELSITSERKDEESIIDVALEVSFINFGTISVELCKF